MMPIIWAIQSTEAITDLWQLVKWPLAEDRILRVRRLFAIAFVVHMRKLYLSHMYLTRDDYRDHLEWISVLDKYFNSYVKQ